MVSKIAKPCADLCYPLTALRLQASFILHPCKLPPRTFYYCIRNLLVHNPPQHIPGPGHLCLIPDSLVLYRMSGFLGSLHLALPLA